jgi:hypothetical protein
MNQTYGANIQGPKAKENGHTRSRWQDVTLVFLGLIMLALYSSYGRPIWFDEFVQYAMGGMDFEYAMKTIDWTTVEVNQGQTGIYHLMDYALMQVFGASAIALRLPSLIAAAVMLFSAVTFIRVKGFAFGWQTLMLLALGGSSFLMYFTGEARSYMAMAASAVAMLAFYSFGVSQRRAVTPQILAVLGILLGSVMHPYWIIFFGLVLLATYFFSLTQGFRGVSLGGFYRFSSPAYGISGMVLYVVIGQLTWMRRSIQWSFDPWEYSGGSAGAAFQGFLSNQFSAGSLSYFLTFFVLVVVVISLILSRPIVFSGVRNATVLLGVALLSSAIVTGMSLYKGFWVYQRQWLGGLALGIVALVWLFAEANKATTSKGNLLRWVPTALFVLLISGGFLSAVINQVQALNQYQVDQAALVDDGRTPAEFLIGNYSDIDPVVAANINIQRGGKVWPYFTNWYNNEAGMRPEFREYNPSWSKYIWENQDTVWVE